MAEKLDPHQVVTFEEVLMSIVYEQEALVLLLEEKGILTRGALLEKIKDLRTTKQAQE